MTHADDLAELLLDREELMVRELLDRANAQILDLKETIRQKDNVIEQCLKHNREQAVAHFQHTEAMASELHDLRQRVGLQQAHDYAAECQRTAEMSAKYQR